MRRACSPQRGFSLIELVLAIGLSIALVALLGLAINLHLVRLEESRSTVEQAQVARAILDRIVADLRGATMAPSQDVSALMTAAESSAQFDVDEVDQTASTDEASDSVEVVPPGINGTINSVTIDRRLLGQTLSTPAEATTPVARLGADWVQVAYGMSVVPESPGLVRTETSRDKALWQAEQGQAAVVATPIAPEVQNLVFRYYATADPIEVWDMQEQEALPLAVEVLLTLAPADPSEDSKAPLARRTPRTYRRFVRLPAAEGQTTDDESTDTSTEAL